MELAILDCALANSPFAGKLHHFVQIDSTNTYALEQARQGAPHGSVYVADEQLAGRGRSDHEWISTAGDGLYVSVLLRLNLTSQELVWIPLIVGLATHAAIREVTALVADLRWPNDILIDGRKVAGVLVETLNENGSTGEGRNQTVVVGVGVNLHQRGFPAGLATPATSLDLETGRTVSREQLLIALLQSLQIELQTLELPSDRQSAIGRIPHRLESISSWIRGRAVQVHGPQACAGMSYGLNAQGMLQVLTADGLVTVTTGGLRALNGE